MDKIIIVREEYRYNGIDEDTLIYPCATEEVAKKVIADRYEWYKENSYLNQFVDENGDIDKNELDEDYDCWLVTDESVEVYIDAKDTRLNLCYFAEKIIKE